MGYDNLHIKLKDDKLGKFYYYKYILRRIYSHRDNIRKLIQRMIWSRDLKKYADSLNDKKDF